MTDTSSLGILYSLKQALEQPNPEIRERAILDFESTVAVLRSKGYTHWKFTTKEEWNLFLSIVRWRTMFSESTILFLDDSYRCHIQDGE